VYQYTVTRHGDRWEFRPSDTFVYFIVCCWAGGIGLFVWLAFLTESFFRIVFLLAAALLAGGIVWALATRRTPLTVERTGRVSHGERELCAAGTVRGVRIADARTGDSGDCEVCLELGEGKLVYLPSSSFYFGSFPRRDGAHEFGRELAAVLGVEVRG
jgi:hypothetical protein